MSKEHWTEEEHEGYSDIPRRLSVARALVRLACDDDVEAPVQVLALARAVMRLADICDELATRQGVKDRRQPLERGSKRH